MWYCGGKKFHWDIYGLMVPKPLTISKNLSTRSYPAMEYYLANKDQNDDQWRQYIAEGNFIGLTGLMDNRSTSFRRKKMSLNPKSFRLSFAQEQARCAGAMHRKTIGLDRQGF